MREANCSGHLHPAWHLTASTLHILSASLKLLKAKSYTALCGEKNPWRMISSLLLCQFSKAQQAVAGEEPQHWVFMWTQWPDQLGGGCLGGGSSSPRCWCSPAHNTSLHICSVQKLHGPPSTVQRWLSDLLHCPRERGFCKEPATMEGCQEISAVWV